MNKMYYGPKNTTNNAYRISPVPKVVIAREINYANDVIIGYTYILNLNGFVSSYRDLRNNDSESKSSDQSNNIAKILGNMEILKGILLANGSFLRLLDNNNSILLEANGGTLKSLSFDESDNHWTNFVPFSAQIEFNEVNILGESLTSAIDSTSITTNMVDINKYKLKTFTENWNFDINEDTYYNSVLNSDIGQQLQINNSSINIAYDLSATGKNYYNSDGTLKAAWTQAKDFVQERMYLQLKGLIGGILRDGKTVCEAEQTLGSTDYSTTDQNFNQIDYIRYNNRALNKGGMLKDIQNYYKVYNETVTCATSESEGTFSLKYNSLLKHNKDGNFNADNVIHTVNKTINSTLNTVSDYNTTISVEGKIQGLLEGGLINSNGNFQLPRNGTLLIANSGSPTKFDNALTFLSSVISIDDDDLKLNFKTALGITYADLGITGNWSRKDPFTTGTDPTCSGDPTNITPVSFNLTKNYIDASISYSVEYSSNRNGIGDKDSFITFTDYTIDEPVSILAEHVFPGSTYYNRDGRTVFQDIDTVTARKISINIKGRNKTLRKTWPCEVDLLGYGGCNSVIEQFNIPEFTEALFPDYDDFILTTKQINYDPRQGSYTASLSYTCTPGCKFK